MTRRPILTLSGVEKAYPIGEEEQLVLKGVDFTLYEGEMCIRDSISGV